MAQPNTLPNTSLAWESRAGAPLEKSINYHHQSVPSVNTVYEYAGLTKQGSIQVRTSNEVLVAMRLGRGHRPTAPRAESETAQGQTLASLKRP